jgi:uncharacterized membrane protein
VKGRVGDILRLDSRAVVRMALGAALYGVFSWLTNVMLLPSASLISLRPAIVIPIFFGLQWGPKVGFFSGLVGNLIGDTISGMGFFPPWDLGNGIVGGVAGIAPLVGRGRRVLDVLVVATSLFLGALGWWMSGITEPLAFSFAGPGFVPADNVAWPFGIGAVVALLWIVVRGRSPAVEATLFGVFAIVCGMGTAALIDVPYNGIGFRVAMLGEFLPASVSNTVNVLVLLPPMLRAYERALVRGGRA